MAQLENNFLDVLAEKQVREKRVITPSDMSREAGIAYTTAQRWMEGKVYKYDGDVLEKICNWVPCTLGQLLRYVPPVPSQNIQEMVTISAPIAA